MTRTWTIPERRAADPREEPPTHAVEVDEEGRRRRLLCGRDLDLLAPASIVTDDDPSCRPCRKARQRARRDHR